MERLHKIHVVFLDFPPAENGFEAWRRAVQSPRRRLFRFVHALQRIANIEVTSRLTAGTVDRQRITGNSLNDDVRGGPGNDRLDGGINTDVCAGSSGTDTATRCETVTGVP